MGRKIPGKKHRGIKDPEKQNAQRWAELKTKINNPPKNIDDQTIPKSLERVMKLTNDVKSGKISEIKKNRKKTKNKLITLGPANPVGHLHPKAKPEKCVPVFNQKPGESKYAFWNRVSRETHNFLSETQFEKKYDVQIKRNPETGKVEGLEKRPKDELDELMKLKMKNKNIDKKKKKINECQPKLTKVQKRKQKLNLKKAAKLESSTNSFESVRETVAFGDIAHAPPELKVKPTKSHKILPKPANNNLLLNSLLDNGTSKIPSKQSTIIDKTGKRKNLPAAERRILEKQQNEVIEAYKLLKARKLMSVDI